MSQATKESAREYMQQRQSERRPLPDRQEIRRIMGWDLIDAARDVVPQRIESVSVNQVFA